MENQTLLEWLFEIAGDGGCDEETGSVQENGNWYGMIVLGEEPNHVDAKPHAAYIITEDSQGFKGFEEFLDSSKSGSAHKCMQRWYDIEKEIESFMEGCE